MKRRPTSKREQWMVLLTTARIVSEITIIIGCVIFIALIVWMLM